MRRSNIKYTIVFTLLILFVCAIIGEKNNGKIRGKASNRSTQKLKCNKQTHKRLDSYMHKLLHTKFPTNNPELKRFCNQGYKSLNYGDAFVRQCLPEFSKKAVSVVLFPIHREINAVCKSGRTSAKAKELMMAAECGNAAFPGLAKCYNRFVRAEITALSVNGKRRMPIICCEFNKLRECFISEAEEVKICTPRLIDYVDRWATQIYSEILDIMCFEYTPDSDRCDKVLKEMPKLNFTGIQLPKSFLSPLIDVVSGLGEEETIKLRQ